MSSEVENLPLIEEDTEDDELDWEEVQVPIHPLAEEPLEITLEAQPKTQKSNKKKGLSHAERSLRIDCHKIHTVALIANAYVRNRWINDPLLHARLLSLTPIDLQNGFSATHKTRVSDQLLRARMFQRAMVNLVEWWAQEYFEVLPGAHIRNRPFDDIQEGLESRGLHRKDDKNRNMTIDEETLQDIMDDDMEPIRSPKSLMKHALNRSGSRDVSAQLFTALCRALGIPARLVVSIQSVPWKGGTRPSDIPFDDKGKGKGKATDIADPGPSTALKSISTNNFSKGPTTETPSKSEKAKGKQKESSKSKPSKKKDKADASSKKSRRKLDDPFVTPPVFWTEVFSKSDAKWLPVDPIRCYVNKSRVFDPVQVAGISHKATFGSSGLSHPHASARPVERIKASRLPNQLLYVLAFEEDGYARDVTRRYAKQFSAKVAKAQGGSSGRGNAHQTWWLSVVSCITRPYRLHRDDLEDQELEAAQMSEGMPTTVTGFKDHAIYVLERHLKQTETIYPPDSNPVARFRGEPVYLRSSVVSLKTSENWLRSEGRMIKPGEQPMKMVKLRAGTINKMRELEVLKDELRIAGEGNGEGSSTGSGTAVGEVMQGMYAYSQTAPYIPSPVIDGIVPKNNFGNIDLYVPSMLPQGGAHIPYKGVAKIARKLGFDYAEAVTGFEFKKRRAFPVIEGIVVAAEHEAVILEAYWEMEREAAEKAKIQKEERIIKQWSRLVQGLRIRDHLQRKYGTGSGTGTGAATPVKPAEEQVKDDAQLQAEAEDEAERVELAGGYLAGAGEVVQPFHLPKDTHIKLTPPPDLSRAVRTKRAHKLPLPDEEKDEDPVVAVDFTTYDPDAMDVDLTTSADSDEPVLSTFIPKTLAEMAADAKAANPDDELEKAPQEEVAGPEPALPTPKPGVKLRLSPRKSTTPSSKKISTRATRSKKSATPVTPAKRTRSTKQSTTKKARPRKKRRVSDSEEDVSSSEDADEVIELDDDDDDGISDSDVIDVPPPAPVQPATPSQPPVSTGRTLRPRPGKTPAQVAAEKDMERAFRRATAR